MGYADSLKTSDLKDDIKQHMGQDSVCHGSNDCQQANEGQQIEGKDNAVSGFNDQSKNVQQHLQQSQPAGLPQTGTLVVTKNVTCPDGFSCPLPSDFTMHVTGAPGNGNPGPSSFAGSEVGTTVMLNVGSYNVTEDFQDNVSSPLKVVRHFSEGCSGSITSADENRECKVTNEFVQKEYLFLNNWGSYGTGNGQFSTPFGVAVNPTTGNVFVADSGNNRIQVFDGSSGAFITKFGTGGTDNGQFDIPAGVAVNPTTGNVFVADSGNNRIQVFFIDP